MTENPWITHSSRVMYKNAWITVREDQVTRPDGKPGIYGVVETRLATGVLALTEADAVYLVGQYRYPMECYSWEIIEGGSDPGEDALEACKRELLEEAGLTAAQWEPLGGEIHLSNCHSSERGYLYVARGLHEGEASPEGTEALQIRKVPWSEALAMVDSGEIQDALSIMAILRYERVRHMQDASRAESERNFMD
ncbi:MAG: NUDIX hydrolase [Candidatus Hydrogenedentes bacterium]|nr:NUDIX hydrolase [Candidatus Hydrogenedentota bacterium]